MSDCTIYYYTADWCAFCKSPELVDLFKRLKNDWNIKNTGVNWKTVDVGIQRDEEISVPSVEIKREDKSLVKMSGLNEILQGLEMAIDTFIDE